MFSQRKRSAPSRHWCLFQSGKLREPPKKDVSRTSGLPRRPLFATTSGSEMPSQRTGTVRESRTGLDSVSAVGGLFSVEGFQVARGRIGPLICTLYAMVQETRERWRGGAGMAVGKEGGHQQPATFLLLREISYSSNACLELCGAHVNGKSPADCSDNEFGGFGGGYGEK